MKYWWLLAISLITSVAATAAPTEAGKKITAAAQLFAGKQMWKGYGLPNGTLGCAAALSNVLKAAGVSCAHSAAVVQVRRQLLLDKTKAKELMVRNGPGE